MWLLSKDEGDDAVDVGLDVLDALPAPRGVGVPRSGSGSAGGGGASGGWSTGEAAGSGAGEASGVVGDVSSGAVEAIGSADEGVVAAVPLVIVIGIAALLATALGFAVFGLFGVDVLMGVAVEIAFASAGGALAEKANREGWMLHAVRRTAGPMAIVLVATVGAGLMIESWAPGARTMPEAIRLLTGR